MRSSIQTRYWGKRRYQDGQIMDLVGQIMFRFLKWPKIFISHNTKGIYNLLQESALVPHPSLYFLPWFNAIYWCVLEDSDTMPEDSSPSCASTRPEGWSLRQHWALAMLCCLSRASSHCLMLMDSIPSGHCFQKTTGDRCGTIMSPHRSGNWRPSHSSVSPHCIKRTSTINKQTSNPAALGSSMCGLPGENWTVLHFRRWPPSLHAASSPQKHLQNPPVPWGWAHWWCVLRADTDPGAPWPARLFQS